MAKSADRCGQSPPQSAADCGGLCPQRLADFFPRRTLSEADNVRQAKSPPAGGQKSAANPRRIRGGQIWRTFGGPSARLRRIRSDPRRIRQSPPSPPESTGKSARVRPCPPNKSPRRTPGRTLADSGGLVRTLADTRRIRGGQSPPGIVPTINSINFR